MKVTKETKDEAADFVFARRIQTGLDIKFFEPYQSGDPFMTSEMHEYRGERLKRQQQIFDYIYELILNDIKNDNESN
jgi:hypothetical protein